MTEKDMPRTLYGPLIGLDWGDIDQLDCYLIREIPAQREPDGGRGLPAYEVRAYRQQVGVAPDLVGARNLVLSHIREHLTLIEEPDSDQTVWEVGLVDAAVAKRV